LYFAKEYPPLRSDLSVEQLNLLGSIMMCSLFLSYGESNKYSMIACLIALAYELKTSLNNFFTSL
jgi:hypothetical protein